MTVVAVEIVGVVLVVRVELVHMVTVGTNSVAAAVVEGIWIVVGRRVCEGEGCSREVLLSLMCVNCYC